jgi:heme-degrading monooxygenase HmoA
MSRVAKVDVATSPRGARSRTASRRLSLKGRPASGPATLIARIWRGQTLATRADDYTRYLYEAGVRKIAGILGNRGVQMLRMIRESFADFQVLSYWDSVEAIKLFAGHDYEKVRHLPDDPNYMVGSEPTVQHFEVIVNDWPRR